MAKSSKERRKRCGCDSQPCTCHEKQQAPSGHKSFFTRQWVMKNTAILLVAVLMAYFQWYRYFDGNTFTLASRDPLDDPVWYEVPCSEDYSDEKFHECKPKQCGRVVRDNIVSVEDAEHLLRLAKRGLSHGGSNGGASILDLHSGALSMGDKFVNIYKIAEADGSLFTEKDFRIYRKVKDQIRHAIAKKFQVPLDSLYLTKPTFFSRMDTTPPKTIHDEYWHVHVDKETYGSFHYTSLLYLTTYGKDFNGGRFIFVDDKYNKTVEPRIGRVSFFTSGSENPHFVERLTDGVRYAITVSFTCDPEKAIADPALK